MFLLIITDRDYLMAPLQLNNACICHHNYHSVARIMNIKYKMFHNWNTYHETRTMLYARGWQTFSEKLIISGIVSYMVSLATTQPCHYSMKARFQNK
jgi:hypothetical protein